MSLQEEKLFKVQGLGSPGEKYSSYCREAKATQQDGNADGGGQADGLTAKGEGRRHRVSRVCPLPRLISFSSTTMMEGGTLQMFQQFTRHSKSYWDLWASTHPAGGGGGGDEVHPAVDDLASLPRRAVTWKCE